MSTANNPIVLPAKTVYTEKGLSLVRENTFFTSAVPLSPARAAQILDVPLEDPGLSHRLPKMPIAMWRQIMSFHIWSVRTFRKETHLSHFITKEGKFITLPFHQELEGMTIKINLTEDRNVEIINKLIEEHGIDIGAFHGTTHNHVTIGASQSGVDSADEANTQGFHFTIGNLDKENKSIHARISVIFNGDPSAIVPGQHLPEEAKAQKTMMTLSGASMLSLFDIPELDANFMSAPKEYIDFAVEKYLTKLPEGEFPEEWKERVHEKKYYSPTTQYTQGRGGLFQEEEPLDRRTSKQRKKEQRSSGGRRASHHTSPAVDDDRVIVRELRTALQAELVEAYDDFKELAGMTNDVGFAAFLKYLSNSAVQCPALVEFIMQEWPHDVAAAIANSMYCDAVVLTPPMFSGVSSNIVGNLTSAELGKLAMLHVALKE